MKCRRVITILVVQTAIVCASSALAAEDADPATVDSCLACHKGPLSLKEETTDSLLAMLKAINEGSATHPVEFPELNDEELVALAEALTGN